MAAASKGHNSDVDSYIIVANIVERGGNVYAETTRYNYGPIWFNLIFALNFIASLFHGNQDLILRYLIAGFLSIVDTGIFLVLWKKFNRLTACLFYFNPISIIITGYHSHFDNFSILLGMFSAITFDDDNEGPMGIKKTFSLLLLGFSITTKHLFFAFPFWLAVKQKTITNRIIVIAIPVSFFVLSFIPYWQEGQQGIIQNVFNYKSFDNQYFFQLFVPRILSLFFNA
ncbi:MAG: hypothetical protein HYZ22_15885, partial [Chloroflexi bacterium]|nr:hypothetical protein [Chloroflexota bacterium]